MNTLLTAFATRLQGLFTHRFEHFLEQLQKRLPMQSIELKVKIKSLAAEARIIKQEEQKALRHARSLRRYYDRRSVPLVAENEIKAASAGYDSLHYHRIVKVRGETRLAGLAYGFLRGMPYRRIEAKYYEAPNWMRLEEMIRRFSGLLPKKGSNEVRSQELQEWLELPAEPGHEAAGDSAVEQQHLQALARDPVAASQPAANQQQQRAE